MRSTTIGSGARASSPAAPAIPQRDVSSTAGGRARTVSKLPGLPESDAYEDQDRLTGSSCASSTDRLWRRFFRLALDSPSTSELRTVFSRACGDAFAGDGPMSSALKNRVVGSSDDTAKKAVLITSEVWKAVDAMSGVAAEFPYLIHQRLLKEISTSSSSRAENHRREIAADSTGLELSACRLDFFTLGRLLRPLVLGRTGNISTPAAVQRFFCHEVA